MIAQPAQVRSFRLTLARGQELEIFPHRPSLMGVVNITPDSFSDGGSFFASERAVDHALRLIDEGADIVDLGAESTRPGGSVYGAGAREVEASEELARLLPVLTGLRRRSEIPISVDTRKAAVARAALEAGADLINDVSGLDDPETAAVAARAGCPVVLMHHRGIFSSVGPSPTAERVVEEVRSGLETVVARALAAGCRREQLVLDPGLGFGKRGGQNFELLRGLGELAGLGRPILVGASRKSFLGEISGVGKPSERLPESLAAAAWATVGGASLLRVHDVDATRRFLSTWAAIEESTMNLKTRT